MWLAALVVRLQFYAAPESGGRQPLRPSQRTQLLSPNPDASRSTGLQTHHGVLNVSLVQFRTARDGAAELAAVAALLAASREKVRPGTCSLCTKF